MKKELNTIRRNNMVGDNLMKALVRIYQQHNIRDWVDRQQIEQEKPVPRNGRRPGVAQLQEECLIILRVSSSPASS